MDQVGTHLRQAKLDPIYDTIVIGSGIGGLTTAACLAKAKQRVLVLESHTTAGGFTHSFRRHDYEWDVGVHYVGQVHRPESTLRRIFDYIADRRLHWQSLEAVYDQIEVDGRSYEFVAGRDAFQARLTQDFPGEALAIRRYLRLIEAVNESASGFFAEKVLPRGLAAALHGPLTRRFRRYANLTTAEALAALTSNQTLIRVLTGQWGNYGLPPSESSFAMHALVAAHYLDGASYPVGGAAAIARSIEPTICASGGQIVTQAAVAKITVDHGKATGIQLVDGQRIAAKNVVSAIGVSNTFGSLLPDPGILPARLRRHLAEMEPSIGHIGVYVGLSRSAAELGIKATNIWIHEGRSQHPSTSRSGLDFPVIYVSFPSAKDPQWQRQHPGRSTIAVVAPVEYRPFLPWAATSWQRRGKAYESLKAAAAQDLLAMLVERLPKIKDHVDLVHVSTPLTTAHFCRHLQGQMYGLRHDPSRFRQRWLRPETPIKHLYLTGQDIVTCGVGGACLAGVLTATRLVGLREQIRLGQMLLGWSTPSERRAVPWLPPFAAEAVP